MARGISNPEGRICGAALALTWADSAGPAGGNHRAATDDAQRNTSRIHLLGSPVHARARLPSTLVHFEQLSKEPTHSGAYLCRAAFLLARLTLAAGCDRGQGILALGQPHQQGSNRLVRREFRCLHSVVARPWRHDRTGLEVGALLHVNAAVMRFLLSPESGLRLVAWGHFWP